MTFRSVLQFIYIALLRLIGVAIFGFALLFVINLGAPNHPGMQHWLPITATILTFIAAVCYTIPRLSPRWLTHPAGFLPGLGVAGLHAVAPLVFMIPIMGGIIATGVEEPLSRHVSVGATLIIWLMSGAAWWLGVILSIWRKHPPAVVPTYTPPPLPREKVDVRALRKARTA